MPDSKPVKRLNSRSIIVLVLCLLFINLSILFVIHIRYQDSYVAAQEDKIALLENTLSPRIILVGGSNVAFGVDSAMLQESTGYHVVNMGLNANLGLRYMLSVVQAHLQPGDLVVILPEYQQFLSKNDNIGPAFVQMMITSPELFKYVSSPEEVFSIIQLFPYVYTQAIQSIVRNIQERNCVFCANDEKIYYREAFNSYGDIISHESIHPVNEISHLHLDHSEKNLNIDKAIREINIFSEKAALYQATTVMLYPATSSPGTSEDTIKMLAEMQEQLDSKLDIDVLGEIEDAWYSRALFFDTYYHLTPEGRTLNTTRIIELLEPYIQNHFYN